MTAILSSPNRLFLSLCRAHRIAWSDRWLLWRLAASQRLEDPVRVFLEPERLDPDAAGPFSAAGRTSGAAAEKTVRRSTQYALPGTERGGLRGW